MTNGARVLALGDGGIALSHEPLFAVRGPTQGHFRVLMTADAVGGVWTYALDLARGFAERHVKVGLAVLGPPPTSEQLAAAGELAGLELFLTGLELDWTASRPADVLAAGAEIASLADKFGADVVHLNTPALGAAARFPAPVVAVCHSCVATWWEAVRDGPIPPDFEWRTRLLAAGLRRAGAVVAPTRAFAEVLANTYRPTARVRVIHNGRHLPDDRDPLAAVESRSQFAFTAGRLWDDGKNLRVLDQAAARLDVPVLAAGPLTGPGGVSIRLGAIHALGALSSARVLEWVSRGPIFVSTAVYEPFGLAVLEAAQAGCALVLSDIPTFRELWAGAAEFVDPADPRSVADGLARLFGNHARRTSLAAAARKRSARYSVRAMAAKMDGLYRVLAAGRSEPVPAPRAVA